MKKCCCQGKERARQRGGKKERKWQEINLFVGELDLKSICRTEWITKTTKSSWADKLQIPAKAYTNCISIFFLCSRLSNRVWLLLGCYLLASNSKLVFRYVSSAGDTAKAENMRIKRNNVRLLNGKAMANKNVPLQRLFDRRMKRLMYSIRSVCINKTCIFRK